MRGLRHGPPGGPGGAGRAAGEAPAPARRRSAPGRRRDTAAYFAYDADRDLMIALLAVSLVGLVAYAQIWGGLIFGI
jgi:hypothetical protein